MSAPSLSVFFKCSVIILLACVVPSTGHLLLTDSLPMMNGETRLWDQWLTSTKTAANL